jgi:hypothetical protein
VNRFPGVLAVLLAATLPACAGNEASADLAECPASWERTWTADSTLSLCIAPGFLQSEAHSWQRLDPSQGADPQDFFSVEVIRWPDDSVSLRHWPPRLGSDPDCRADCITVDSMASHSDRWAGNEAATETGRISGGLAGLQRRPVFVSGWIVASDRRGFAQGWATVPMTLDTLRQMLRTVRVAR